MQTRRLAEQRDEKAAGVLEVRQAAHALLQPRVAGREHMAPPGTATMDPTFPRNFGGLVLGCIDSYDSEERRILQHNFFEIYKLCIALHLADLKN